MKQVWRIFSVNGEKIEAFITQMENDDKDFIKHLYFRWKNLNDTIKSCSTRGVNLPEIISENAFCVFFENCVRIDKLKHGKCSFDVINTKTGSRIQIKACSVASDLTSFGPRSEWDELFFLDFSAGDGSFKVYKIEPDLIYNHKVNKNQTFAEQQAEGKRPRFSIIDSIIKPLNMKPTKVCTL